MNDRARPNFQRDPNLPSAKIDPQISKKPATNRGLQNAMRPDDRRYFESHEWVKIDGDTMIIGITDFAVQELSSGNEDDLVYCDLPEVGRQLEAGETFGEIESVKAVSDLNCPVAGEVVEVNTTIEEHLEVLAKDPWKEGWLIRIRPTSKNLDGLMNAAAYEKFLAEKKH